MVATYVPGPKGPIPVFAATAGAESTVLFDASGINGPGAAGVTFSNWSLATPINVGGGSNGTTNLCLVAALYLCGATAGTSSSPALSWDSSGTPQSMTLVPSGNIGNGNCGDIYFFYLMNPTLGSKVFNATWTGANQAMLCAASFVNVDQTGGTTTFGTPATNTGTGTSATVSVSTTPTTRKFVGAFGTPVGFNVGGASGTDIGHNNSGNVAAGAGNWDVGTATSMSYTQSSAAFAAIAIRLKGA